MKVSKITHPDKFGLFSLLPLWQETERGVLSTVGAVAKQWHDKNSWD